MDKKEFTLTDYQRYKKQQIGQPPDLRPDSGQIRINGSGKYRDRSPSRQGRASDAPDDGSY